MNDVYNLTRQKNNLRTLINEWIERDKSPSDIKRKVQEYNTLVNDLNKNGVAAKITSVYLKPEFWDKYDSTDCKKIKKRSIKISANKQPLKKTNETPKEHKESSQQQQPKPISTQILKYMDTENYYIINVVWNNNKTGTDQLTPEQVDNVITDYLSNMQINKISQEYNAFWNRVEYIFKYEFKGNSSSMNIISDTINYLAKINNMNIETYNYKKCNETK